MTTKRLLVTILTIIIMLAPALVGTILGFLVDTKLYIILIGEFITMPCGAIVLDKITDDIIADALHK